jgi:signal transduction histidine kinase
LEVVEELEGILRRKKIIVRSDFADNLGSIYIDRQMIREVYRNILTNAIKYSKTGAEVEISLIRDSQNIVSMVKDNGIGIPEKDKENIFNKFYRGSNALSAETEGTGLGLHLTKSIVEASNGKIWYESKEGRGTTFWFTIPVSGVTPKPGEDTIDESDVNLEFFQTLDRSSKEKIDNLKVNKIASKNKNDQK